MNMFNILFNYHDRYVVTNIDENQMEVFKHNICNFIEPLLLIKASKISIGESPELDDFVYDGNMILVGGDDVDYIFFSGFENIKSSAED